MAGHAGFGQALSFDGTDDYVDLGFVGFPTYASSITIEAWFRTSAITEQYILQYGELDPPGPNGALVSLGTGKLESSPVSQLITTPRGTLIQAGTNIADGQWHHGAMTFDQPTSRLRLYVDGTLEAGPSTAGLAAVIATNFAYVGWEGTQSNCCFWTGEIDELRIYNHALTASELGLTPSELGIPEPTTLLLLGTGLAIAGYRRRRQVRR